MDSILDLESAKGIIRNYAEELNDSAAAETYKTSSILLRQELEITEQPEDEEDHTWGGRTWGSHDLSGLIIPTAFNILRNLIMPPRRLKKKSVRRLVEKRVAKAIEEYKKYRANLDSAESSGGNTGNAGGTVNV
ncbi:hypothetical protein Tco_1091772 [Tanacetum coccineum]|uniref:Uncharacterized protein n=1 Tax=Tanacetum coccineum TaxID=301880 RepID=A0ABQ5I965_9ASTR